MGRNTKFEGLILVVLTLVLTGVFVLSTKMYDSIENESSDGALAAFADNVRGFVDENEAVAAFFGFEETAAVSEEDTISKEAAAYIERYNEQYEDTP